MIAHIDHTCIFFLQEDVPGKKEVEKKEHQDQK